MKYDHIALKTERAVLRYWPWGLVASLAILANKAGMWKKLSRKII